MCRHGCYRACFWNYRARTSASGGPRALTSGSATLRECPCTAKFSRRPGTPLRVGVTQPINHHRITRTPPPLRRPVASITTTTTTTTTCYAYRPTRWGCELPSSARPASPRLTHSHSLTHSSTHSPTHSPAHSLAHSLPLSFSLSLSLSLTRSLAHSLTRLSSLIR